MCLPQFHRRHYKLTYLIFIVPPVALMKAQVVILYFFRLHIVNSNKVISEILERLGDNYEVNILSEEN